MGSDCNIIWCREVLDTAKETEAEYSVSPAVALAHAIWVWSNKSDLSKPAEVKSIDAAARKAVA